ncbi:flagellin [Microvirga massiliensis]|uniref:flagellin N-terminal helical domain-containing protein n=1 Tax=Microvirga massiliensis TaxID=1033741 RepID=UPI00062BA2D7|nr:flagellin [Microvirga massiliensis]
MADIALSQGVRQNLLAMQKTVDLMARTQNRLATGKKVNSALDNPTSYFVSAGLENRANDLSRLLDSMGLGIKTLEAADNGIKALKKLIETAQATARQALQAASSTPRLNSVKTAIVPGTLLTAAEGGAFEAGNTISITLDSTTPAPMAIPFPVTATSTVEELADKINADLGLNPANKAPRVHATVENGRLVIESLTGDQITLTAADGTGTTTGKAAAGAANLFGPTTPAGTYVIAGAINSIRQSLAEQFEGLKAQMDQLVKDTGYNGVNLLNGDTLKVLFNENNTTFIDIAGVVFNSLGLGLSPLLNGDSADTPYDWQSDTEIKEALSKLDTALNRVRSQASNFGSNLIVLQTRQDFTKQSIATLNGGSDLLVLADTSEEGANLLALQTRQQLSTQALSLAAQTDQAVLRLFG